MVALDHGQERAAEEGMSMGRVRAVQGGAWRRPKDRGGQAGREELARLACAPGTQLLLLLARGRRQCCPWWAGLALPGWAAAQELGRLQLRAARYVSVLSFYLLFSIFFFLCFDLV